MSNIPSSKHLFQHTVHNYLYASSGVVRAQDFNNTVDAFVQKLVRKKYLVLGKNSSLCYCVHGLFNEKCNSLCDSMIHALLIDVSACWGG